MYMRKFIKMQQEPLYPNAFEQPQTSENPAWYNIYFSLLCQEKGWSSKYTEFILSKSFKFSQRDTH